MKNRWAGGFTPEYIARKLQKLYAARQETLDELQYAEGDWALQLRAQLTCQEMSLRFWRGWSVPFPVKKGSKKRACYARAKANAEALLDALTSNIDIRTPPYPRHRATGHYPKDVIYLPWEE